MNTKLPISSIVALTSVPFVTSSVFAQTQELQEITSNLEAVSAIVRWLIIITISAAFLVFFYNAVSYIFTADGEKEGQKSRMIWSLIVMVIITSLWGIIIFFRNLIGIDEGASNNVEIPTVDFRR